MRYCLFLFLVLAACHNSPPPDVKHVNIKESPINSKRRNIVVTVTGDNKVYVGNKELPGSGMDSVLGKEIQTMRQETGDSIAVVIHADTNSRYKTIFAIIQAAQRARAKVVVDVAKSLKE
jgi:biopolymer transport protein ExbD